MLKNDLISSSSYFVENVTFASVSEMQQSGILE